MCRVDCTFCGDGVVQMSDGETCDDGNTVSGCQPDKPQRPLDDCLNNCQEPLCEDPAKIKLNPAGQDALGAHGRLIATTDVDFNSGDFRVKILRRVCSHDATVLCGTDQECDALSPGSTCTASGDESIVFDLTVPGQALGHKGSQPRWRYKNYQAKTEGGIYTVAIKGKMARKSCAGGARDGVKCTTASECPAGVCFGFYVIKVKAFGDAGNAVPDMQTEIFAGGHGWAVRGMWQRVGQNSWRLNGKSDFLEPWF
jgi:hypothetical protein